MFQFSTSNNKKKIIFSFVINIFSFLFKLLCFEVWLIIAFLLVLICISSFYFFERIKIFSKISSETETCKKSDYLSLRTHVCLIKNKCNWKKQNMLGQLLKTTFVKTQKGCECPSRLKFYNTGSLGVGSKLEIKFSNLLKMFNGG